MRRCWPLIIALAASPGPASAHLVGMEFGDFYAGALHLIYGPEYLALIFVLGLVVARQAVERAQITLAVLPVALLTGAALALIVQVESDAVIASALAGLGLIGLAGLTLPSWALIAVTGLGGGLLGYQNMLPGLTEGVDRLLYAAGVVATGIVLGTLAIGTLSHTRRLTEWAGPAQRVLASWMAAVGTLFLGVALFG